ncbi:peptidylprolyl isomerase [Candidatus Babeliales bacterium]|nr:peptidylprolyl isomerase [Candidatus Babeliales bacterium]
MMAQAKKGDIVKIHYTGKLSDGTIFDSSLKREPIQFTVGEKKVIPGFEDAVLKMEPGDKSTVTIPSDKAYGPHRKELIAVIERKDVPKDVKMEVGQMLRIKQEPKEKGGQEQIFAVTVTGITDTHVTVDANHPLAGKDLTFELELVDIK